MFGKVFASMYDGTLATRGPWQALVTFQQMIVLCDRTGIVDMTADALSRRTTIPIDIINIGIAALEQEDTESRSPELGGRRIVRLSEHRDWGWQIVNYELYRKIRSEDERREYMANLMRDRRKKAGKTVNGRKHPLAKLAHADADADAVTTIAGGDKIYLHPDGAWRNISTLQYGVWKKAYPAVDIPIELNAAAAWIVANPSNKKSNYARFLNAWLKKAQDRAPRVSKEPESRMGKFVI